MLATYVPAQAANISGQTEIYASLRGLINEQSFAGAASSTFQLAGHELPPQHSYCERRAPVNVQIGAVTPIVADYLNGMLSLQPGEIKGTSTDVHFPTGTDASLSRQCSVNSSASAVPLT